MSFSDHLNLALVVVEHNHDRRPQQVLPPNVQNFTGTAAIRYRITAQAQQQILHHARQTPTIEVGGLLLGDLYQHQDCYFVQVTHILPAKATDAGALHVTFTSATWIDLIQQRSQYQTKPTVGWYHSHPGIGVFLSAQDRLTHQSFFGDRPWYLAIVIDPQSNQQGVFVWDKDQIISPSISDNSKASEQGY